MIPESFFDWPSLGTYAGATLAVMVVVEFTKELPGIKAIPTRLWAYIVAVALLVLSTVFTGNIDAPTVFLCFVNAVIVAMAAVGGYDITDMWVMSVFNRLNERCRSCKVTRLTSQWNIEKETVWLMTATGFPGVGGTVLIAVAPTADFRRFGFFSLDFSNK